MSAGNHPVPPTLDAALANQTRAPQNTISDDRPTSATSFPSNHALPLPYDRPGSLNLLVFVLPSKCLLEDARCPRVDRRSIAFEAIIVNVNHPANDSIDTSAHALYGFHDNSSTIPVRDYVYRVWECISRLVSPSTDTTHGNPSLRAAELRMLLTQTSRFPHIPMIPDRALRIVTRHEADGLRILDPVREIDDPGVTPTFVLAAMNGALLLKTSHEEIAWMSPAEEPADFNTSISVRLRYVSPRRLEASTPETAGLGVAQVLVSRNATLNPPDLSSVPHAALQHPRGLAYTALHDLFGLPNPNIRMPINLTGGRMVTCNLNDHRSAVTASPVSHVPRGGGGGGSTPAGGTSRSRGIVVSTAAAGRDAESDGEISPRSVRPSRPSTSPIPWSTTAKTAHDTDEHARPHSITAPLDQQSLAMPDDVCHNTTARRHLDQSHTTPPPDGDSNHEADPPPSPPRRRRNAISGPSGGLPGPIYGMTDFGGD